MSPRCSRFSGLPADAAIHLVGAVGLEPTLLLRTRIFSPVRLPIPPRPRFFRSIPVRYGGLRRCSRCLRGRGFESLQGPFGDGVGEGTGEVEGGEGVEALDVSAGSPHAGDAGAVAGEVFGVNLFDRLGADLFGGGPHAAGGFEACDRFIEARAGDPEARRHILGMFVLYDAREAERTAGGDAERSGVAAELYGHGVAVSRAVSHQLSAFCLLPASLFQKRNSAADGSIVIEGWRLVLFLTADGYFIM